jgi:hypothetical protein
VGSISSFGVPELDAARAEVIQDPCAPWDSAPPLPRAMPLARGDMLACKVATDRKELKLAFNAQGEATTRADLNVELTLESPRTPRIEVTVKGPDDRGYACATLPLVDLAPGGALRVHVEDRGVFTTDADLGVVRLVLDPTKPLVASNGDFGIECRRVPRAVVEDQAAKALALLDLVTAWLDRNLLVDLEATGWGRLTLTIARDALVDVAAWVGWDDPRVLLRIERLVALERRLDREMQEELTKAAAAWPKGLAPLDGDRISVEALFLSGGEKRFEAVRGDTYRYRGHLSRLASVLAIRVRNDSARADALRVGKNINSGAAELFSLFSDGGYGQEIGLELLDARGRYFSLAHVGRLSHDRVLPVRDDESFFLNPGESVDLLFEVVTNLSQVEFEPEPPPLQGAPASLEPFVLIVQAPKADPYAAPPAPLRLRVPVAGTSSAQQQVGRRGAAVAKLSGRPSGI